MLPELFPCQQDWDSYLKALYQIYMDSVVNGRLSFRNLPVRTRFEPATKGMGYSFWHTITEGEKEAERTVVFEICERIRWIAWFVRNAETCPDLKWWMNKRDTSTHVVIWHEKEKFAVVLAKRADYYVLKTAYVVKPNRARIFKSEYEK